MLIQLPIKPMSINAAFQGRRYKTKEYKAWEESVLWLLKKYADQFTGKVEVRITWYLKNASRTDLDNPTKLAMDALTKSGIIRDDRDIWYMTIEKVKSNQEGIDIEILPFEEER